MERQILDFYEVFGNSRANANALSTFRIHRAVADPEIANGRMLCSFNAVDVPVRKSGAWYFFKKLFGQQTIAGGMDLEQVRRASFDAGGVFQIKIGKPNVYWCLPDDFDDLPESIKKDELLNLLFNLYYSGKKSTQLKAQILTDAGIQKTEQQDILAQSNAKYNQYIINTVKQFQETDIEDLRKKLNKPDDENQPKKEYY